MKWRLAVVVRQNWTAGVEWSSHQTKRILTTLANSFIKYGDTPHIICVGFVDCSDGPLGGIDDADITARAASYYEAVSTATATHRCRYRCQTTEPCATSLHQLSMKGQVQGPGWTSWSQVMSNKSTFLACTKDQTIAVSMTIQPSESMDSIRMGCEWRVRRTWRAESKIQPKF